MKYLRPIKPMSRKEQAAAIELVLCEYEATAPVEMDSLTANEHSRRRHTKLAALHLDLEREESRFTLGNHDERQDMRIAALTREITKIEAIVNAGKRLAALLAA
jgi:hypothetical protein